MFKGVVHRCGAKAGSGVRANAQYAELLVGGRHSRLKQNVLDIPGETPSRKHGWTVIIAEGVRQVEFVCLNRHSYSWSSW